jgi:oligopeptidase B
MKARIKETDVSLPYLNHGYFYYKKTFKGQQYRVHFRKLENSKKEELLVDENAMASGKKYFDFAWKDISPDTKLMAYAVDYIGHRDYELHIQDFVTKKNLSDSVTNIDSFVWSADSAGFYYTKEDETKRSAYLYFHKLGTETKLDPLIFEEKDPLFSLGLSGSRDDSFVWLESHSKDTAHVQYIEQRKDPLKLQSVRKRKTGLMEYLDNYGQGFVLMTNDRGVNFRILLIPNGEAKSESHWQELLPHDPNVYIASTDVFRDFMVIRLRIQGKSSLRFYRFDEKDFYDLPIDESNYSISGGTNMEFAPQVYRFEYESMITPLSVVDVEIGTWKQKLLKRQEVASGYKSSDYVTEYFMAPSHDGVLVPIQLVYKKGLKLGPPTPLLLYGYGAYGSATDPDFSTNRFSLLDRGFVYAEALVRGGSDLGRKWYLDGKMKNKKNSFLDFIAAAEELIRRQYTSPDRLVISGASAGGLLIGAVTNMRPELFKIAWLTVPFVDVLNTMSDASLPLTTEEYLEWGNPHDKREYEWIKEYCPYTNLGVHSRRYPTMLVKASLHDSQVPYWEAAKYVAKLRSLKTDSNPILFRTDLSAGHSGSSGRYDYLKDRAFDYAFLLRTLKVER